MNTPADSLVEQLRAAIPHFWTVRQRQAGRQGRQGAGRQDRGGRGAVTGGKQMDGFLRLIHDLLIGAGLTSPVNYCRGHPSAGQKSTRRRKGARDPDAPSCTDTELPGWFRAEKDWDLLVVAEGRLVAAIEFKSQVGPSFGNNFNNRTEEALGNAIDLWAAFREGAFKPSQRPRLGYLMLLEDAPGSTRPVRVSEPHFAVFPEFNGASYTRRYEILLTKLVRERLYDAACFLMSTQEGCARGEYREPAAELSFQNFISSLLAHAIPIARTQGMSR